MSILAMKVLAVHAHPNADALRVYELSAPDVPSLVVVANLEHTYEIGSVVAIARVGAVLADGTVIHKVRLRGVDSFGMALGPADEPPGTDLSARHGRTAVAVPVVHWASIELFHNVRIGVDAMRATAGFVPPAISYRAKVKLDGTCGALHVIPGGSVVAQSRTQILSIESDNHGFAAWAVANEKRLAKIAERTGRAVIFGEWAGPGIQRRTAVSKIDRKTFAVFAVQIGDPQTEAARLVVDPDRIAALVGDDHEDVYVLPWHGDAVRFDFADVAQIATAVERVNTMVAEVEREDPWVKSTFGIDGLGEGLVLYPVEGVPFDEHGGADRESYAPWMFKAKGEKHQVVKQKQPVQIDPEVAQSVDHFVDLFVTPARLAQGLEIASGGAPDVRNVGAFLKWISTDVEKESAAELAASGLTWKQVGKAVGQRAREWFLAEAKK